MNANELMVGDYVYNHRNWECPIVEIHKNSALVIAKHYGEEEFLLSDLRPIPLTPEILEKNGFKLMAGFGYSIEYPTFGLAYHDGFREYYSIDITLYNYPMSGVKILVRMERNSLCGDGVNKIHSCDIEYIHQLQHALRLCGIEKEIIL